MAITKQQLFEASAKDTYIILMTENQRAQAVKDKLITQEDINRVGPALTAAEKRELFSTIPFARILYLVTVASLGKAELELDRLQNDLKNLNEWIQKLNDIMAHGTELNAKKDEKDRRMVFWDEKLIGAHEVLNAIKTKFGDKVDIELFFRRKDPNKKDDKYGGMFMDRSEGIPANIAIEKIRNISTTLDNEVKTNSTKIQKVNSTYNTLLETISFVSKKVNDAALSALSKI